jgi:hypothetical protein
MGVSFWAVLLPAAPALLDDDELPPPDAMTIMED